jgi:hypothetical protein
MGKQLIGCVHCGKPNQVDILDERDIRDMLRPLLDSTAGLGEAVGAIKNLPEQLSKGQALPANLADTLTKVATAGENMERAAQELNAAREQANTATHPAPTMELIEHWQGCPDCKPGWDEIKGKVAEEARKGYIPLDEAKTLAVEVARQAAGVKVGDGTG